MLPALIVLLVLFFTRERFPLTPLAYWLILVHSVILMVGGHYTYAEVPVGDWLRDLSGGSRNNRVVAIRGWLPFIVVSICLAISAFYELIEWWVALLSGEAAEAFLGTQGYIWDTQSDMFLAFIGAILALLILSRIHDHQIGKLSA